MSKLKIPVNSRDHIWGKDKAEIELVEYGDYQCSNCGRAFPLVKQIREELGNRLRFIFRNFPLKKIHVNALKCALAAEAAARQNKFWQMHDMIFKNQKSLEEIDLLQFAEEIQLDMEQFKKDIVDTELIKKVESDFESGIRSGVNRTPSFFINEEKYEGRDEDLLEYIKVHYLKIFDMENGKQNSDENNNDETKKLYAKIMELTSCIRESYPELLKYLEEMTITLPTEQKPGVNAEALKKYYDTLKAFVSKYTKTHQAEESHAT